MSTDTSGDQFCKLPDDLLLKVFRNLSDFDLISVRKVSKRFETVSQDKTLVRHIDFSSCYGLSSTALIKYLRPITEQVESLSLNNCYWLSAKCCDTIMRCRGLLSLHLLHVRISTARLVTLLGHLKQLQCLSVNLTNLREFQKMLAEDTLAQATMTGIRVLTLRMRQKKMQPANMTMQLMSVTSFFEYCSSLEEFHMQGPYYNCGIPNEVVRPQIKQLHNLKNLHTMTMTDTTDASVRMFFFGVLLEVARLAEVQFRSLLMPMVVTRYLAEQRDYVNCIQHIEGLRHFDISYSTTGIPSQVHQFDRAQQLTYLNLSENVEIDCRSLKVLANSCPNLTSINLRNCHHLHHTPLGQDRYAVDISGLQMLVMNCAGLTSLNLSGVHIHPADLQKSSFTSVCQLLALNHNWRSLSLSPCSLSTGTVRDDNNIHNNRKRSADQSHLSHGKRQRTGFQTSTVNLDEDTELKSELGAVVRSCPLMEHFELIGANFRSSLSKRCQRDINNSALSMHCQTERVLKESDLMCIRRWKNLRTLQLSAVAALQRGDCLAAVLRECGRLERLMISELGVTPIPAYQQTLMHALPFAHRLKDLRIEQGRLHLRYPMWEALSQMPSLQRLCILGKKSTFCPTDVHNFVQRVPSLVLIQLFISELMSIRSCNELQTKLVTTFKEQRPALSVCVMPLLFALSKMEDMPIHLIPDVHLETMSILTSSIAHTPDTPSPTHKH